MVLSLSLICNLQFILLLAVFSWSLNNDVCMQCHRDKLQEQLSQDSNSYEDKQHIHCSLSIFMINKKSINFVSALLFTADFDTEVILALSNATGLALFHSVLLVSHGSSFNVCLYCSANSLIFMYDCSSTQMSHQGPITLYHVT